MAANSQRNSNTAASRCQNEGSPKSAPNRPQIESAPTICVAFQVPVLCNRQASTDWICTHIRYLMEGMLFALLSSRSQIPVGHSTSTYIHCLRLPTSGLNSNGISSVVLHALVGIIFWRPARKTVTTPYSSDAVQLFTGVCPVQHGNAKTMTLSTPQCNFKGRGLHVPRLCTNTPFLRRTELKVPWAVSGTTDDVPCRCHSPQTGSHLPAVFCICLAAVGVASAYPSYSNLLWTCDSFIRKLQSTHYALHSSPFFNGPIINSRGSLRQPHIVFPVDDSAYAFAAGSVATQEPDCTDRHAHQRRDTEARSLPRVAVCSRFALLHIPPANTQLTPSSVVQTLTPSLGKPDTVMAVRPRFGNE
ncbi:hypothetical protein BDP55DRAFT_627808 [Colletotrichum godetiae]|uniref:Uncharacterized protein n=1 Tax=Colletotrichum godetiae TaxID=1209918 RepID=A0AAJ0ATK4_9PEZI|nr:uncharacterized protein BDP55DRAFT_627808 [Colletotrichum godetiae]KAK1690105.1 hypothetical protein BDP55DRAFT_627808 [Colletotrichum godetiae]